MLEDLYDGIGGKIKGLAKVIFVVEAVLFVIAAFILMSKEELTIWGILLLIGGPIFAWISSWLLYAFGELVEKNGSNAKNTRAIVVLLEEQRRERDMAKEAQVEETVLQKSVTVQEESLDRYPIQETVEAPSSKHLWRCEKCGKMISTTPCVHCGYVKPRQKLNEK